MESSNLCQEKESVSLLSVSSKVPELLKSVTVLRSPDQILPVFLDQIPYEKPRRKYRRTASFLRLRSRRNDFGKQCKAFTD